MSKTKKKGLLERLVRIDRKTHQAVEPYTDTPPVKTVSWLSEMGDQPQMLTLAGGALAYSLVAGRPELKRAATRAIAAHLLATAIKTVIKRRVDRTRPFAARTDEDLKPKPGRNKSKEETSFPSGHSAGALAVAQAFARELPEHRGKALAGAGLIALAQIPRCAHYPTDVGAGLAIGWVSEQLVDRAFRWARAPADQSPIPILR
jgi:membrane-associated phospholipid phosphatase